MTLTGECTLVTVTDECVVTVADEGVWMTWVVEILPGQNEAIIGERSSNSSRETLLTAFLIFLRWFQTDITRGNCLATLLLLFL